MASVFTRKIFPARVGMCDGCCNAMHGCAECVTRSLQYGNCIKDIKWRSKALRQLFVFWYEGYHWRTIAIIFWYEGYQWTSNHLGTAIISPIAFLLMLCFFLEKVPLLKNYRRDISRAKKTGFEVWWGLDGSRWDTPKENFGRYIKL